ncbi:adenosylcobinamide-phosphate synthase CbiB [Leptolyngbya iicbica]|uniref:Cobalamin biosynthesis protein CobD n=2 Tax=Cyanophyceae TaxID=3028117 RepID=A0A4Q7E538_9CYAN|nr:adenosylcobinamide-phosphate synthase CbiB [Leptolyngbya sp. LK]RZM77348.1 cobalamin biosynthesis protein CobD [Leptolyngbya sp. LK]
MPVLWCSWLIAIPLLASLLDFVVGDPWHWPHPVQVMGWIIQRYQTLVFKTVASARGQRWAGVMLGVGLPLLSGAIAAAMVLMGWAIHPLIGGAIAAIILASCLAARSLRRAAEEVLQPLETGDLVTARDRLGLYVGRDTDQLTEAEVLRAVVETISENATDGVMAPLFYGLVGFAIAPAWGVGAAIAYKALSTLDSMIGYQTPPYQDLGWFSARSEDVVTWLPCRLTVMTIALLSGRPRRVWQLCRRDAAADPSPNAGWSECAYAAALGVQLGGRNTYRGEVKHKPLLAEPLRPITPAVIQQGLRFTRWAVWLWLLVGCGVLWGRYTLIGC